MNTVTLAVLLVCITLAYASASPTDEQPAAPAEELLQGEEARWHGGGNRYHGGGGRHPGGGGQYYGGGGRYHGGGGRYHGGGGRWRK